MHIYCLKNVRLIPVDFTKYDDMGSYIEDTIKKKCDAMRCYKGEIREYPHPRSIEILEAIAKKWGSTVNFKYAEAFEQVYKIEK